MDGADDAAADACDVGNVAEFEGAALVVHVCACEELEEVVALLLRLVLEVVDDTTNHGGSEAGDVGNRAELDGVALVVLVCTRKEL